LALGLRLYIGRRGGLGDAGRTGIVRHAGVSGRGL